MKQRVLWITFFLVVFATCVYASTTADDMPINQPIGRMKSSMALSMGPMLIEIALIITGLILALSRQWRLLGEFAAVVVGGTIVMKAPEVMSYFGWSGTLF